jgi:isoquinoline 1-oxidoreductase subunit alpha
LAQVGCVSGNVGTNQNVTINGSAKEDAMMNVRVNGQDRTFDGDPSMPLMWYLRDVLGLTGTKFGCGVALCGVCTVHLDGDAVRSCGVLMSEAAGKSVTTIEGLDAKGEHPVQAAWRNLGVPQCGYCQSGQIMQAAALLAHTPGPSDQQILEAMSGNLCRCGCYQRIHQAVRAASKGA